MATLALVRPSSTPLDQDTGAYYVKPRGAAAFGREKTYSQHNNSPSYGRRTVQASGGGGAGVGGYNQKGRGREREADRERLAQNRQRLSCRKSSEERGKGAATGPSSGAPSRDGNGAAGQHLQTCQRHSALNRHSPSASASLSSSCAGHTEQFPGTSRRQRRKHKKPPRHSSSPSPPALRISSSSAETARLLGNKVQGAEIKPTEAIEEEEERGRKTSRFNGKDNDDHRLLSCSADSGRGEEIESSCESVSVEPPLETVDGSTGSHGLPEGADCGGSDLDEVFEDARSYLSDSDSSSEFYTPSTTRPHSPSTPHTSPSTSSHDLCPDEVTCRLNETQSIDGTDSATFEFMLFDSSDPGLVKSDGHVIDQVIPGPAHSPLLVEHQESTSTGYSSSVNGDKREPTVFIAARPNTVRSKVVFGTVSPDTERSKIRGGVVKGALSPSCDDCYTSASTASPQSSLGSPSSEPASPLTLSPSPPPLCHAGGTPLRTGDEPLRKLSGESGSGASQVAPPGPVEADSADTLSYQQESGYCISTVTGDLHANSSRVLEDTVEGGDGNHSDCQDEDEWPDLCPPAQSAPGDLGGVTIPETACQAPQPGHVYLRPQFVPLPPSHFHGPHPPTYPPHILPPPHCHGPPDQSFYSLPPNGIGFVPHVNYAPYNVVPPHFPSFAYGLHSPPSRTGFLPKLPSNRFVYGPRSPTSSQTSFSPSLPSDRIVYGPRSPTSSQAGFTPVMYGPHLPTSSQTGFAPVMYGPHSPTSSSQTGFSPVVAELQSVGTPHDSQTSMQPPSVKCPTPSSLTPSPETPAQTSRLHSPPPSSPPPPGTDSPTPSSPPPPSDLSPTPPPVCSHSPCRLHQTWVMWYDCLTGSTRNHVTDYQASLSHLTTIQSVEDFWRLFNNILPPNELQRNANYHFFKEHIQPLWEDPANKNGGKWVLTIRNGGGHTGMLDRAWLELLMALIGEHMSQASMVNGAVLSTRKKGDRIALWTSMKSKKANLAVCTEFIRVLTLACNTSRVDLPEFVQGLAEDQGGLSLVFMHHADSLKSKTSYQNDARILLRDNIEVILEALLR